MLGNSAYFGRVVLCVAHITIVGMVCGQNISDEKAVELAERFVRENGYTNAPDSTVKSQLDYESISLARNRAELLQWRWNTLQPKAIGAKATDGGWGVAFDYVNQGGNCRVVTMLSNGTQLRMKHQDGIREYWFGFDRK